VTERDRDGAVHPGLDGGGPVGGGGAHADDGRAGGPHLPLELAEDAGGLIAVHAREVGAHEDEVIVLGRGHRDGGVGRVRHLGPEAHAVQHPQHDQLAHPVVLDDEDLTHDVLVGGPR
jgi:hypothetical protein